MPAERFTFGAQSEGSHVVVTVAGEIDLAAADRLWTVLEPYLLPEETVVVDCSGITFLDSTGLRTLIRADQRALEAGASFRLAALSDPVNRVLELAGVETLFTIQDTSSPSTAD